MLEYIYGTVITCWRGAYEWAQQNGDALKHVFHLLVVTASWFFCGHAQANHEPGWSLWFGFMGCVALSVLVRHVQKVSQAQVIASINEAASQIMSKAITPHDVH